MGNCDVHCRIVDVLLQKGPWNISKGGGGGGKREGGYLEYLFYLILILFYLFNIILFYFSEMVSPPDVSSLRGVKRKLIN